MNRFHIRDLGIGVGLRTTHFAHILGKEPAVAAELSKLRPC